MAKKKRGRLEKLGKLSVAILEHKVEDVIGEKAIEILKQDYSEHTALITSLAYTEERFRQEFEDEEIDKALFDDLSLEGLPSLEAAFSKFYARPTAPQLPATLKEIISKDLSALTEEEVEIIVNSYLDIFTEELAIEDEDFRENARGIADLRVERILRRIDQRLAGFSIPVESIPAATKINALHQLTPPPADFTGREEELDNLRRRIKDKGAAITGLRGMGGIGKTALARVIAEELKDDYPDAQIELNLKGVTDEALTPEDALAYVIHSFHPGADLPDDRAELEAIYRSTLEGKRALLLMDNARDAAQVEGLLPPKGNLLLVTSRKHITLTGLKALELGVMEEVEAVELLMRISARTKDHAAQIAKLCDYLPLALRLAASALDQRDDLTPERYIQRLEDQRLKTLDLGADATKERPGVAATLQLSYDLLPEGMQKLWRGLAIFPQDFNIHAAFFITQGIKDATALIEGKGIETILDGTGDQLADLVGYSLLEYDRESRRYRLHDLGREFASIQLEGAGEKDTLQRNHAQYYFSILRMADDHYQQGDEEVLQGLRIYDLEAANIQAGQSWAARHMDEDELTAEMAAKYPNVGANILNLRLHAKDFILWLESSLTAAQKIGNRADQGTALGNLGVAYSDLGDYPKAVDFQQQALAISREIGDRQGESQALGNLGNNYFSLGETEKAIRFLQQSLDINQETGDRQREGQVLSNLGVTYYNFGEKQKAIDFFLQALAISIEIGDRRGQGAALGNLGITYKNFGEIQKAIDFYQQHLDLAKEIGDRLGQGNALGNLGSAYWESGQREQAIAYSAQAFLLFAQLGAPQARQALGELAEHAAEMGAEAFQMALAQSGLPEDTQQAVLQALAQAEEEQPDLRQGLIAFTIDALTNQPEKKEGWWEILGKMQDQAKNQEIIELVTYLDLLRRLVEGTDPAKLAGDVPEEFKADWAEIEKGLKKSK